jgi:hypothetical protein
LAAGLAAAVVFGTAGQAQAADSADIGWIKTDTANGKGYFDADVSGWAGAEELTACDIKSDGESVTVELLNGDTFATIAKVKDGLNDGSCTSVAYNMAKEGTPVLLVVYQTSNGTNAGIGVGYA